MNCEMQFLPANNTFLYCSETCRLHDLNPPQPLRQSSYSSQGTSSSSPPLTPYTRNFAIEDGPDIIPRFSPTQPCPRSYFNSEPYNAYQAPIQTLSSSTPHSNNLYADSRSSNALASLRELATTLPKTRKGSDPESPPKSGASSITRNGSTVWNYIPFTTSGNKTTTPSATPKNSYGNSNGYPVGQSYGAPAAGRSKEDLYSYGKSHCSVTPGYSGAYAVGGYGNTGGMGMDRPLPPRSGPGGYGHRPKSIDLVTPFSTGH